MPRLSDRPTNALLGTIALIHWYRQDPDFEGEFQRICQTYHSVVKQFAVDWLNDHRDAVLLAEKEYQVIISGLKKKIQEEQSQNHLKTNNFDACINELGRLARRWKLGLCAPLAGLLLFLSKFTDEIKSLNISFKIGPSFHPYLSIDAPSLELGIIAPWLLNIVSPTDISIKINVALSKYITNLKASGLTEYPSKLLSRHAYWWFQHNVKGKSWKDLANEEGQSDTEGGTWPENIRKAVLRFSALIGVPTR